MTTQSMAMTTIATGSTDVRATHVGSKYGRVKPTKIPPAISRRPSIACKINWPAFAFVPCPTDHSRNCSTPNLASWSNAVENTSVV